MTVIGLLAAAYAGALAGAALYLLYIGWRS